ncbi:hypothetical protein NE237_004742 [Protea cynaroides]|uniref:Uncharacterized protein n=1 Tax=Protea cynaroides TaxID=273540 RepID=A0A9Q0KJ59_9MAGN|nr:hypothetical protein NE237_004742 [Protea cynaroides]
MGPASANPIGVTMSAGRTAPRPDQVDTTFPVPSEHPSRIPKLISPTRATFSHWVDAEDDDDFGVEDGELQNSVAVSIMRIEAVSRLPMLALEDISELSSRGLPSQMVSPGAVIAAAGDFTEVGKHHRGRLAGRGNSHGVDATQSPRVNFEDMVAAMAKLELLDQVKDVIVVEVSVPKGQEINLSSSQENKNNEITMEVASVPKTLPKFSIPLRTEVQQEIF